MSTTRLVLAVALLLGVATPPVWAAEPADGGMEATLQELLDTIRANRKALVAVNLNLNEAEAAAFWPLYDRYQGEMHPFGDRVAALLEDYERNFGTLSNEKALQLMEEYLTIDAERVQVRRKYLPEFAKILPGRTVARFYQIENKMDAVIRYDLAKSIPVVEE
jgi:hypothetical protein